MQKAFAILKKEFACSRLKGPIRHVRLAIRQIRHLLQSESLIMFQTLTITIVMTG